MPKKRPKEPEASKPTDRTTLAVVDGEGMNIEEIKWFLNHHGREVTPTTFEPRPELCGRDIYGCDVSHGLTGPKTGITGKEPMNRKLSHHGTMMAVLAGALLNPEETGLFVVDFGLAGVASYDQRYAALIYAGERGASVLSHASHMVQRHCASWGLPETYESAL